MLDTRETIKQRMLRDAGRHWDRTDVPVDTTAFDPLVDLLVGALATESERVYQTLHESRGRIVERLVQLLLPDVAISPRPAHAVLTVQPTEPAGVVGRTDTFTSRHPQTGADVPLSAAGTFPLVSGRVAALAAGTQLWRVDATGSRQPAGQAAPHRRLPDYTLWIGLERTGEWPADVSLRFYFDWKNEPQPTRYVQALPYARWFAGEQPLDATAGYGGETADAASATMHDLERYAQRYYGPYFLTISGFRQTDWVPAQTAPVPLTDAFEAVLPGLGPLLWLRVELPPVFTADVLNRTDCVLNAFPVLSRQLGKTTFRLGDGLNVFPLNVDAPLLELAEITDSEGHRYEPVHDADAGDATTPGYALRQAGVGRFDARDADALVRHLLDQLRDESAAFVALGPDTLRSQVDDIGRSVQRIRQVLPALSTGDPVPFLVLRNAPATGTLFVSYWATVGERANRLPGGSRVDTVLPAFRRESAQLLSPLIGGTARLDANAGLPQFRRALLTRGRALTEEDIRAVCFGAAPNALDRVTVQKGVVVDSDPRRGLVRTLDVRLRFRPAVQNLPGEPARICRDVAVQLGGQWAGVLPLRVLPDEP